MSYCRFRNTIGDLIDCQDALCDCDLSELSIEERKAACDLIRICREIAEEADDFESELELDEEVEE
jgi:hypothetical protein